MIGSAAATALWAIAGRPPTDKEQTMDTPDDAVRAIARLVAVMDRLRDPETGCAWDLEQDFASIAPYTIEEAHEVADAIDRGDMAGLRDELGDLLLQVVFHARMAAEGGHFTLSDVAAAIVAKMERRHPHIFGPAARPASAVAVRQQWEAIKASEAPRQSALDGIAAALPALLRAHKIAGRAAQAGFDWPDDQGPRAKIAEELAELDAARTPQERLDEAGDLLFSIAVYLRHHDINPEEALRQANARFERRFRAIEAMPGFAEADLSQKDRLWQMVKQAERNRSGAAAVPGPGLDANTQRQDG
jgi:ATP diphosphatase